MSKTAGVGMALYNREVFLGANRKTRRGGSGVDVGTQSGGLCVGPLWPRHFKEDVLRVKRSRFTSVILSGAKDLSRERDPSLRSG